MRAPSVNKYVDHLPPHRLEGIFAREGVDLSRSTLCEWVVDLSRSFGAAGRLRCDGHARTRRPERFLADFQGALQDEANAGYDQLYESGRAREVGLGACSARFVEALMTDAQATLWVFFAPLGFTT